MYIKHLLSRFLATALLVVAGTLAVCAAESWKYYDRGSGWYYSGGSGTKDDPYLIGKAQDLADLAYFINNKNDCTGVYFKQTKDIVLNDFEYDSNGNVKNVSSLQPWTPIGDYGIFFDDDFQGIYDGDGHTIYGVYIGKEADDRNYVGLFGSCEDAIIKNLTVKDVLIDVNPTCKRSYIGGLVGRDYACSYDNVKIEKANITVSSYNARPRCGGLVGFCGYYISMTNSSFNGNITVNAKKDMVVGGLVGYKIGRGSTYIFNCHTGKGKIIINDKGQSGMAEAPGLDAGGLIGYCESVIDGDSGTGLISCTNSMDIETGSYYFNNKWRGLRLYSLCNYAPMYSVNCTNFGSIRVCKNVYDSRIGFAQKAYMLSYCASFGKYIVEKGSTYDRGVYIDGLGLYNKYKNYGESALQKIIDEGKMDEQNGVFICPNECLPDGVSEEWIKKYYNGGVENNVSLAWLKTHGKKLAESVNENYFKLVFDGLVKWGVAENQGNAPIDITGCPMPLPSGTMSNYLQGNGTETDPYLISSLSDLRFMRDKVESDNANWGDKYYKMTADIDMANKEPIDGIGKWNSCPFSGTFDGDGHVISNFNAGDYALFCYLDGTVKNLGIVNITQESSNSFYTAGIAFQMGVKNGATITNCYVGGNIYMYIRSLGGNTSFFSGMADRVGAGKNTIKNCYFKGVMDINPGSPGKAYYYGLVREAKPQSGGSLTCSNYYASFVATGETTTERKRTVTGLMPKDSEATIDNCFYVCSSTDEKATFNSSLGKELETDADLAEYFTDKDGWLYGAWRPVLNSARHYQMIHYYPSSGNRYADAIPMVDDNNAKNSIYTIDLYADANKSYIRDPLLWSLPNVAVYDKTKDTDYILNCYLVAGSDFYFNRRGIMAKGAMHYPLTVSQNGYSMLCLPGIVRKECLPEGSKLYICGEVNYGKDGKMTSNIVECDTVPAGVPFLVKVPTERIDSKGETVSQVGETFDVVMRGEIADAPRTTLPLGAMSGMDGAFRSQISGDACIEAKEVDGLLQTSPEGKKVTINALSGYFRPKGGPIFLTDYVLLDETANDIDEVIADNAGTTVNIKLKRALKSGEWNAICLPFSLTGDEVKAAFGDGTLVEELTTVSSADGVCTLTFSTVSDGTEAGKAYLIKPSNESPATVLSFPGKALSESKQPETNELTIPGGTSTLCLQGNYARTLLDGDNTSGSGLYFMQDNTLHGVAAGSTVIMDGFRCFIRTSDPNALSAARMVHCDGSITSLRLVQAGSTADGQRVYNIQGMQTNEHAGRGVYIKNGRKYVKK